MNEENRNNTEEKAYCFDDGVNKTYVGNLGEYISKSFYSKRLKRNIVQISIGFFLVILIDVLIFFMAFSEDKKFKKTVLIVITCSVFVFLLVFLIWIILSYRRFIKNSRFYVPVEPLEMVGERYNYGSSPSSRVRVRFEITFKTAEGTVYKKKTKYLYSKDEEKLILESFREKKLNVCYYPEGKADSIILPDW